ncbi:ethanolamine utilization protein EutP [Klebsiella pneumoniae]|uniref:Ethanolamine utilization protein EutP n=1 Tax=Klebsiella pneumoniae TaxID=573 RepID=A0A378BY94_KLEPN|nr:ethanolamine utilization protein EutP [Klebsiella pneumoniae]VTM57962.1 ethanolamine utilization protein EutP [Klebsiella pneumoniae]
MDTLIYVHAANDTESRLPPGLLDIGSRKHLIVAISKTDLPDANVAAVRQLLDGWGFRRRFSPSTVAIRKALRRWKIT